MGTLANLISQMPTRLQRRYSGSNGQRFIDWGNDALVELEREGHLPEIQREAGVIVENDVWITPPSDFRRGLELSNPQEPTVNYPYIPTVGDGDTLKLKLRERMTFDDKGTVESITAFSAQATDSITVDITDAEEDDFEDDLLRITAGTIAPKSYILSGNDASAGGTCKLYFLHELASALTAAQATAGEIVDKDRWLLLRYISVFTPMTATTDEIPVATKFEPSIKAFLHWKAYEWVRVLVNETRYWEGQWEKELAKIGRERKRVGRNRHSRGRRLPGFEQDFKNRYSYTHETED